MAYTNIPYWRLMLLYKLIYHARTIVRVADPDCDPKSIMDWLEESELFETREQAQWTMHRLGDLSLSNSGSDSQIEFAYEELEILKAALRIIEIVIDSPIHSVQQKYVGSAVCYGLHDMAENLKKLSEYTSMYVEKVKAIVDEVDQE